jgi:hypothetical protein
VAEATEALDQSYQGGGLAFAKRGGGYSRYVDVFADGAGLNFGEQIEVHLGLLRPKENEVVAVDPEIFGDVNDRADGSGLGNF